MTKILENLHLALVTGLVLTLLLIFGFDGNIFNQGQAHAIFRWLHVFFGITWIGLLYYFNFVQIPTMPPFPLN